MRYRPALLVAALILAGCGSDQIRPDDPVTLAGDESSTTEPDTYQAGLVAACTHQVNAVVPGRWDLVDTCVTELDDMAPAERREFLDYWL